MYNNQRTTHIKTQDGVTLARRETTVRMPNGKFRHPVVYYDITPGVVRVSHSELEQFEHFRFNEMSLYLVNKEAVADRQQFAERLKEKVNRAYTE